MKFSNKVSSKPRKKRLALFNAPLHIKQKLVAIHLGRDLRKQLKKRALPARKGDKVLVLKGKYKKREGVISRINLKNSLIFVAELLQKKQSGKEVLAPLRPSHLLLIQLSERKRKARKAPVQVVQQKAKVA